MTEKRFNYTCEKIGQHYCIEISDNQTKEPFDVDYSEITDNYSQTKDNVEFIVGLLNELHEENTRLKEQLECKKQLFTKKQLHEENQRLKKQLQTEHQMLDNAILVERTRMGKNSLKQYKETIQ